MREKDDKPDLVATITDELELEYSIPRLLRSILASIGPGVKVRVDIRRWYKKRTGKQNAYLWAVVYPTICRYIFERTGQRFHPEDIHRKYKKDLLGSEICDLMPEIERTGSSTELDTVEFSDDFVEQICVEWADLGCYIPPPQKKEEK